MQFSYIKELAESVAGEKVTDVVVTVPPFYDRDRWPSYSSPH